MRGSNSRPSAREADVIATTPLNQYNSENMPHFKAKECGNTSA